jgi:hypothetical protein
MSIQSSRLLSASALALCLAACGGGTGSGTPAQPPPPTAQTAQVPLLLSDASSEDWSLIGVKVLAIDLQPQGGGAAVRVFTAASPAPTVNLAQLDQIGELLGTLNVPVGTYTGATLTVGANPGDVMLTVSADPEAGFDGVPGSSIPSDQIQIQGARGTAPDRSVPVKVAFDSPWVVGSSQNGALDLEVDLSHPAFIVGHKPVGGGATLWAVRFDGPVRHRATRDLRRLVLRHTYGHVTAVANDAASITIEKDLPALPVQSPEVPVPTAQSLQILADATNGTWLYDLDAKSRVLVKDFAAQSSTLPGKYVRIAARYQQDGTLVATRIWTSTQFNSVWVSPEGHVLHVDAANSQIRVADETGHPVTLSVDANTQFFFRVPQDALADATPIGTGPAFLAAKQLVRGFKVHASVVDPLAATLVAQSVDIETATYDGRVTAADATGFTQTRQFRNATDDYSYALGYLAADKPNGVDAQGNDISGFKWWNFAFPTLLHSGASAIDDFVAIANGGVDFGGTVGTLTPWSATFARWDVTAGAGAGGWAAANTVIVPTRLPLGSVANPFAGGTFTMTVPGGTAAVGIDVSTTSGSATLAYQIDRSGGVVTVSAVDVTTSTGLDALSAGLVSGARVKVYGVPQADGSIKAYVLAYYTGDALMN